MASVAVRSEPIYKETMKPANFLFGVYLGLNIDFRQAGRREAEIKYV